MKRFPIFILITLLLMSFSMETHAANPHYEIQWQTDNFWSPYLSIPGEETLGPNILGSLTQNEVKAGLDNLNASNIAWANNLTNPSRPSASFDGTEAITKFAEGVAKFRNPSDPTAEAADIRSLTGQTRRPLGDTPDEPNVVEKFVNIFLYLLFWASYLTTLLLSIILDLSSRLLDFAFSATTIAGSDIVQKGWTFTRDMLNFIFILVLLAISFSTIAGLETFNRKLLPRVLFAALLVNFSLSISGAFLQVANVMTTTIATSVMPANSSEECKSTKDAPAIGCRLALGLTNAGSIGQLYTYKNVDFIEKVTSIPVKAFVPKDDGITWESATTKSTYDFLMIVIKSVMALILIGVFAVAFIFLGILMFVRLIALIILLILSPVPYVFSVVPKAQKYADEWWSKFINYTFFLPIVTFFLALAITLMQKKEGDKRSSLIGQFWGSTPQDSTWYTDIGGSIIDVIFISIFIFAAVYAAKSLSIFGANGALGIAKGTVLGAGKLSMMPARLGAKAALNYGRDKTGISATGLYSGIKEGWASKRAGQLASAKTGTSAQFGARLTGGAPARDAIYNKSVAENQKDMKGMSDDVLREKMHAGGAEGAAAAMQLIENESLGKVKAGTDKNGKVTKDDFSKEILDRIPKSSSAYQKYRKTWVKKDPLNAIKNTVGKDDQPEKLAEAIRTMKPDDLSQVDGDKFKEILKVTEGQGLIFNPGQVRAVSASSNSKLAKVISEEVENLAKKPDFNPGVNAVVQAARRGGLSKGTGGGSARGEVDASDW